MFPVYSVGRDLLFYIVLILTHTKHLDRTDGRADSPMTLCPTSGGRVFTTQYYN